MQLCAARAAVCVVLWTLPAVAPGVVATAAAQGVTDETCPSGAIAVEPGASIAAAVDRAGEGAVFCLRRELPNASHSTEAGQSFHGEKHTILNGSRLLDDFSRAGRYLDGERPRAAWPQNGECAKGEPGV